MVELDNKRKERMRKAQRKYKQKLKDKRFLVKLDKYLAGRNHHDIAMEIKFDGLFNEITGLIQSPTYSNWFSSLPQNKKKIVLSCMLFQTPSKEKERIYETLIVDNKLFDKAPENVLKLAHVLAEREKKLGLDKALPRYDDMAEAYSKLWFGKIQLDSNVSKVIGSISDVEYRKVIEGIAKARQEKINVIKYCNHRQIRKYLFYLANYAPRAAFSSLAKKRIITLLEKKGLVVSKKDSEKRITTELTELGKSVLLELKNRKR